MEDRVFWPTVDEGIDVAGKDRSNASLMLSNLGLRMQIIGGLGPLTVQRNLPVLANPIGAIRRAAEDPPKVFQMSTPTSTLITHGELPGLRSGVFPRIYCFYYDE
jgi:hypothetical protein